MTKKLYLIVAKIKFWINNYSLHIFLLTAFILPIYAFFPNKIPYSLASLNYVLLVILALSGFCLFWQKKELMATALDDTKEKEQTAEEKRGKSFPVKFPTLNRIPVLNHLFRWIYKEGWVYIAILALLLVAAYVLRFMNLTVLEPYSDEGPHLVMAMGVNDYGVPSVFIDGGNEARYYRFYFLTYLIAFLFRTFGKTLFIARLPGVIVSTLTTIPFYFIGRKINKKVGLIAAGIWVFSPWAIAISKNIREYAYFPFLYLFIGLFFIFFAKHLIRIIEKRDFRITFQRIVAFLVFLLPLRYFLFDTDSTFGHALLLYIVFFVILIYNLLRSSKLTYPIKKGIGVFLLITFPILANAFLNSNIQFVNKIPRIDPYWFHLIFGNSGSSFFYNANIYGFYILLGAGILFAIYRVIKNKSLPFNFLLLSFLAYFFFQLLFFKFELRVRYGFVVHVWLIPIVAIGIYLLYSIFLFKQSKFKKIFISLILSVFILTVFSPKHVLRAVDQKSYLTEKGYTPVTNEFHPRFKPVIETFGDEIRKDDPVICSHCPPLYWHDKMELDKNNVFYYRYFSEKRFEGASWVVSHFPDRGWIIMDIRRNGWWTPGFPKKDFSHEDVNIKYFGRYGDFDIYRWPAEDYE